MFNVIGTKQNKDKKQSKEKLERLKLSEIWEIITDKRFGIRFKIANLICRDYLRNYLAAANSRLRDCIRVLDSDRPDDIKIHYIDHNVRRASKTLEEVFDF